MVGVIFEATLMRWFVASLAIRSGNGAMLKGSEARCTNEAVMEALKQGLGRSAVAPDALTLLTTRRKAWRCCGWMAWWI